MTESECRRILGLAEKYTLKEAKQAYRKKVLQTHPDRNQGNNSEFLKVNKAYEVLQGFLANGGTTNNHQRTQQKYRERANAEAAYKNKVKQDLYWKKYNDAKRKKYESEYKDNLKIGFLLVAIIILFCMLMGRLYDPEFNGTKNQLRNEQNND
jgi:curved DNA-binding protein CbpA